MTATKLPFRSIRQVASKQPGILAAALFLATLAVYIPTACLSIYTADNGELVTNNYRLGVPHATGYPAYNVLGKLFMFIPIGSYPLRAAWLSAVSAALSISLLFLVGRRLIKHDLIAAWAALMFGLSRLMWSQSLIGEVYGLHLALLALSILTLLQFIETPNVQRAAWFAFSFMFALTNHLLTMLLIPAIIIILLASFPWRKLLIFFRPIVLVSAFMVLGVYIYLPLRWDKTTIVQWGDLGKPRILLNHILGRQFHDVMFSELDSSFLGESLLKFLQLSMEQIPAPFYLLAVIGAVSFFERSKKLFLFLNAILWVDVLFSINYYIVDIDVYFLQAYMVLMVLLGEGVARIYDWLMAFTATGRGRSLASGLLGLAILGAIPICHVRNYYFNDRSNNFLAHDYSVNILYNLDHRSVLLTQGWSSPFLYSYFQEVLRVRDDVDVYIDNHGKLLQRFLTQYRVLGPIYSNIHMEVMADRGEREEAIGLVYRIGAYPFYVNTPETIWNYYRMRSFNTTTVHHDYHNRALIAMYHYMRGEYYILMNDDAKAREAFAQSSLVGQFNSFIHNNLACIFFRLGWYDEAEQECLAALELNPDFPQVKYNLANIYFRQGRMEAAMKTWQSIGSSGYKQGSHKAIGAIYLEHGEYDKALSALKKAYTAEPYSFEILNNLGIALSHTGKYAESVEYFQQAIKYNPLFAQAYNNLGSVELTLGRLTEAETHFSRALELSPDYLDPKLNLAITLARRGQPLESERLFTELLAVQPDNINALNNLGLLYLKSSRIEEAKTLWLKSLTLKEDQPDIAAVLQELQAL